MKEIEPDKRPKIIEAQPMEDGRYVAILLKEWNGTVSAIRIAAEQLAD